MILLHSSIALICPTRGRNLYKLPILGTVRAEIILKKPSLCYFSLSDVARVSQGKTGFVCAHNSSQLALIQTPELLWGQQATAESLLSDRNSGRISGCYKVDQAHL